MWQALKSLGSIIPGFGGDNTPRGTFYYDKASSWVCMYAPASTII